MKWYKTLKLLKSLALGDWYFHIMFMKFLPAVELFIKCFKLFLKVIFASCQARLIFCFSNTLTFMNWCMHVSNFLLRKAWCEPQQQSLSVKMLQSFCYKLRHFHCHKQFSLFPFNYNPVLICWGAFISYEWLSIPICVYRMKSLMQFTRVLIN